MSDHETAQTPTVVVTELGGNCPVQAEGTIDGVPFYFRARGERWQLFVGGDDLLGDPHWYHEEPWGDEAFSAGWMTEDEARALIQKGAQLYAKADKSNK